LVNEEVAALVMRASITHDVLTMGSLIGASTHKQLGTLGFDEVAYIRVRSGIDCNQSIGFLQLNDDSKYDESTARIVVKCRAAYNAFR
jgi:hypothetical protein